jgi:hypothetical protein
MAPAGAGIRSWKEFSHGGAGRIRGGGHARGKAEVLDYVAQCEEAVELAEAAGQAEIAFQVEGVRRVLLGRLMGDGSVDLDG